MQLHADQDAAIIDWRYNFTFPINNSMAQMPPVSQEHYGTYLIHFAITGEEKGRITDVTAFEWNVNAHIGYRNQKWVRTEQTFGKLAVPGIMKVFE